MQNACRTLQDELVQRGQNAALLETSRFPLKWIFKNDRGGKLIADAARVLRTA